MSTIVYGPQGCGKSTHAEALAAYFGETIIIDEWTPARTQPKRGLVLTNVPGLPGALDFAEAMRRAGLMSTSIS